MHEREQNGHGHDLLEANGGTGRAAWRAVANVSDASLSGSEVPVASPDWNSPADEELNPMRAEEREAVREELEARLASSGVDLTGVESDEQILDLLDAVEAFDLARARRGGDSIVNTPESTQPDSSNLVIPARRDDETVSQYLARLRRATWALADGESE
jgi:hypothetical protein